MKNIEIIATAIPKIRDRLICSPEKNPYTVIIQMILDIMIGEILLISKCLRAR